MAIKKNNQGMSIIEVVVAILIVTIGLVGVMALVTQNLEAQYVNKNVLIASGLAQEGLELTRNIRDKNWLISGNAWNQDIVGDGTFTLDYRGRASINPAPDNLDEAGAVLKVDGTGFYNHFNGTDTLFRRLITVVDQGDYLDVTCAIRWKEGAQNHDYTAMTQLYNWR